MKEQPNVSKKCADWEQILPKTMESIGRIVKNIERSGEIYLEMTKQLNKMIGDLYKKLEGKLEWMEM